jgi:hypothetical protein
MKSTDASQLIVSAQEPKCEAGEIRREDIFASDPDGFHCVLFRAGLGAVLQSPNPDPNPDPDRSAGYYLCILDGVARQGKHSFGAQSLGWMGPGSPPMVLEATSDAGFSALAMQFPSPPSFPVPTSESSVGTISSGVH